MKKLASAWTWIRENAVLVLGALVALLGAGWLWSYHRGKTRSFEVQVAVEKARAKVAALDARREALGERDAEAATEIEAIREEKAALMRETVALEREIGEMSDQEVADAFRDLY